MEQIKFKNKYRTESCRLKGYDYSSNGMYFITICCSNRKSFFGEIVEGKMVLNELGKFAYQEFKNTENIRENVTIDEFVIMPDHVHGVISINYQVKPSNKFYTNTAVETNCNSSLQNINLSLQNTPKQNGTSQTIGAIVRGFKSVVTTYARKNQKIDTVWQKKYFDRIVRDENELNRIREYVILNPLKWEYDENRVQNIYY